jgi:hypothetical protein
MRVYLKTSDLESDAGKQLLDLAVRIAMDGKLDLDEINALRSWLRANASNTQIEAIGYLSDIIARIDGDGIIDRDELVELHLAVERVVPQSHRQPIVVARKKRDTERRERLKEARKAEREKENEERRMLREEEYNRTMRLRHAFAKVAGVTFPNDDGSERQAIIRHCKAGEYLILRHEPDNDYSEFAIQVLRQNGAQLGHAPEYLAERICQEGEAGYQAIGVIKNITGGTTDKPTRGVNFVTLFHLPDVNRDELHKYVAETFAADGAVFPRQTSGSFALHESPARRQAKAWWKFW